MPIDFPSSPTNGQVYGNYTYSTAKGAWTATAQSPLKAVVGDVAPSSPTNGTLWFNSSDGFMYMYYTDGTSNQWVQTGGPAYANESGYRYVTTVQYAASGTFSKGSYSYLRAIRVRCVGGGGGGGYALTTSTTQNAIAAGGGGGAYAESFITDITSLTSSVTVTVGTGGTGGVGATPTASTAGGDTSFGSLVIAAGGGAGTSAAAAAVPSSAAGVDGATVAASAGDIKIAGGASEYRLYWNSSTAIISRGGASGFVPQNQNGTVTSTGVNGVSATSTAYGVGGEGGANTQSQATARNGGAGAAGIVLIDLYA